MVCGHDGVVGKLRPMGEVGLPFEQHEVEVDETSLALDGHRSNTSESRHFSIDGLVGPTIILHMILLFIVPLFHLTSFKCMCVFQYLGFVLKFNIFLYVDGFMHETIIRKSQFCCELLNFSKNQAYNCYKTVGKCLQFMIMYVLKICNNVLM